MYLSPRRTLASLAIAVPTTVRRRRGKAAPAVAPRGGEFITFPDRATGSCLTVEGSRVTSSTGDRAGAALALLCMRPPSRAPAAVATDQRALLGVALSPLGAELSVEVAAAPIGRRCPTRSRFARCGEKALKGQSTRFRGFRAWIRRRRSPAARPETRSRELHHDVANRLRCRELRISDDDALQTFGRALMLRGRPSSARRAATRSSAPAGPRRPSPGRSSAAARPPRASAPSSRPSPRRATSPAVGRAAQGRQAGLGLLSAADPLLGPLAGLGTPEEGVLPGASSAGRSPCALRRSSSPTTGPRFPMW